MMEKIRKAAHMLNRGERPLVDSPVSGLMSDMVAWRELFNFMDRALQLLMLSSTASFCTCEFEPLSAFLVCIVANDSNV
jgi:hypothetical protein